MQWRLLVTAVLATALVRITMIIAVLLNKDDIVA